MFWALVCAGVCLSLVVVNAVWPFVPMAKLLLVIASAWLMLVLTVRDRRARRRR
jgi:hypothetical protein